MAEALDMRLPGLGVQAVDVGPSSGGSKVVGVASSTQDNSDTGPPSKENNQDKDKIVGKRVDMTMGRHAAPMTTTLAALPEAEDVQTGRRGFEGLKGVQSASSLAVEEQNRAEPRLSAEIALAARKAQRVAEVRNIAQEVVRVAEDDASAGANEKERGEIERALAAVDETRRKRMERQQAEHGEIHQDEEKLRRRQAKREQLMKKRKDMEERLEEEATKMAELTESAKKKGESKFMSEEAKRDAEERIRAETEVVAQLERQAAEMALQRENMQKQLAEREKQKVAEIEANSSALKTKRAMVEARMRQEEEEIKSLSEAAKREVEAKMLAEAAAIAEMERQALEMSAKRAELQADMSNKLQLEDTMVQEAQMIARKRKEIEDKMQQEEEDLQRLSEEAKRRVLEKMAAEAAAIADMEREMTPAHLAANNDVLEVLSQHGANLNAKDADLRTPLFVACASDRLEKAEFLCELLEYADQDLGEADKRGDTPMHAAAYNGSTACLLLLLQYGVEPDARNTKGLRPIDLASRRGHKACEKILMEYQLHHHVNNSYFDSVLFLATLEGHKRCKETLTNAKHQGEVAAEAQVDSPLVRPQSLMSLRRERSVRLEHWGDWIAYEDQNEKSVFWYNHVEDKSQRDAPTGVREASESSLSKASMRLKRQGDWIEYTLPDGNVFYYNDKNNEFQWERPDDLSSHAPSQEWAEEDGCLDGAVDADNSNSVGDWTAFKDPSTGLVFWYNHVTDESQWEPPEDHNAADGGGEQTNESRVDGKLLAPEEDVREINDEDDLFTPR
eukprot:g1445.t1